MKRHPLSVLTLAALPILFPPSVSAQDAPATNQLTDPIGNELTPLVHGAPTDPVELETFVDGLMHVILEEFETAGAVVSVVSGGEVFFAKGYGFSDWEERTPVDPERTLFRIGSVSKLFAWTSVMQMVEQGLLDLDADVNQYLDFEVPDFLGEPVTLGNIMAHAGGFEESGFRVITADTADLLSLGELLAEDLPARVRPPGDLSSYSNHATGLAAHTVEQVTGTDWNQYVEDEILTPLGMEYATFRQPIPEGLAPHMSKGYRYRQGRFEETDFEIVPMAPVGAGAVSGVDMATFMIAHLQLGQNGDQRILAEETARLMQTDHHQMEPGVNGMAHGFMVYDQRGERIIGHGGDTRFFHTGLWLFPEHDLGVFVSFNSQASGGARNRVMAAFLDRYFPVEESFPTIPENFAERGDRFTGEFRPNRRAYTTFLKIGALGGATLSVTDRGTLRGLDTHWVEVEPLVFQEEFGTRRMIFRENDEGEITHFFLSSTPIMAWERAEAIEGTALHVTLFIITIALMILTLLSPLIGWAIRRWYGVAKTELVRIPVGARWTLWSAALLFLFAVVVLVFAMESESLVRSRGPGLWLVFLPPFFAAVPTLASVWFTIRMWMKGAGRPTVRVFYSLATLSFCLLLWQMNVWNFLGWHY
jgi:CubicO group peptidase (beta-lactamase class C family)